MLHTTHYYPFGMQMAGMSYDSDNLKYLYNGKELHDDQVMGAQLNWYSYGARFYNPQIGRWMNIDPMAEKYDAFSPYNYCVNDPVNYVDPDGRYVESYRTLGEIIDILWSLSYGGSWSANSGINKFMDNGEAMQAGVSYNNKFNSWGHTNFPGGARVEKHMPTRSGSPLYPWVNGSGDLYVNKSDAVRYSLETVGDPEEDASSQGDPLYISNINVNETTQRLTIDWAGDGASDMPTGPYKVSTGAANNTPNGEFTITWKYHTGMKNSKGQISQHPN